MKQPEGPAGRRQCFCRRRHHEARLADDGAVIGEKTNFLAAGRVTAFREALCSQCNFCSAYCPASLRVRDIAHYVDENKTDKAVLLHPVACMECGLCSAVCLAGRDQAKRIKMAKSMLPKKMFYAKVMKTEYTDQVPQSRKRIYGGENRE